MFRYGYGVTPTYLTLSSVFKDQSTPTNRVVNISNVTDPVTCFEIDGERNKVIDIKKYYKYKFNTSHSSMIDKKFDLSPSINYNVVTAEKETPNTNEVNIKVGFGPRIATNTYTTKVESRYNKNYYFDNNNNPLKHFNGHRFTVPAKAFGPWRGSSRSQVLRGLSCSRNVP